MRFALEGAESADEAWAANRNALPVYSSAPYTSLVHADASTRAPTAWQSRHSRPLLIAARFSVRESMPGHARRLRRALHRSCNASTADVCAATLPAPVAPSGPSRSEGRAGRPLSASESPLAEDAMGDVARLYWRATFCLQPGGDTVSRKSIVDAVLLGCIPVLFHAGQRRLWPAHWGGWVANATVLLDGAAVASGRRDAVQQLMQVRPRHVRSMQEAIARHAHTMQYAAVDTSLLTVTPAVDAFDILLRAAHARATEASAQARGRQQQRQGQ